MQFLLPDNSLTAWLRSAASQMTLWFLVLMLLLNLGTFVSLLRHLNPLLRNPRSGKLPVFLGPAFIHMQRCFEDYYPFFAGLLKLEPQLLSLKA